MTTTPVPSTVDDFIAEELEPEIEYHAYFTHRAKAYELAAQSHRQHAAADRIWGARDSEERNLLIARSTDLAAAESRTRAQEFEQ